MNNSTEFDSDFTSPHPQHKLVLGFITLLISCISLGFMFAPLKHHSPRDGFFVQWVQCSAVFAVGFVLNVARGCPPFNLTACIGGLLYATGNIGSVPIIGEMGVGVGMLVWGSVQIIVGWSVARFGLFGTRVQEVRNDAFNYAGVALTLVSGLMFVFVYGSSSKSHGRRSDRRGEEVREEDTKNKEAPSSGGLGHQLPDWLSARSTMFVTFAVTLGCLHGLMMTPIVYIQENDPIHSDNVLDYVFAHFSAVYFFSTIYFLCYILCRGQKAYVPKELILPSVAYGLLWSAGMVLWIVANRLLPQTVAFPIAVRLPAIIGALADVFLFKSNMLGGRQLLFLFAAIAVGVAGVTLVAVSL